MGSLSYLPRVRIEERTIEALRKWFNGTIIYRKLLDNLLQFKKEDCLLIAIKFDIEITTVVNKCKVTFRSN